MGRMTLLGAGASAAAALPGPPTFTAQTTSAFKDFSGASPTYTSSLDIGTATSTRLVVAFWYALTNGTFSDADFGGLGKDFLINVGTDVGNNLKFFIAGKVVPTGTTVTLTVTTTDTLFSKNIAVFTANSTDFVSTTPLSNLVVGASPQTAQANVSAGGAVLALCTVAGGSMSSPIFTAPNDPNVASDFNTGFQTLGHANNSSAFTPASVSMSASGTGGTITVAIATFR